MKLNDDVRALMALGWEVSLMSCYDEEGVEGWCWIDPSGREYHEFGDWTEPPTLPATARKALEEADK